MASQRLERPGRCDLSALKQVTQAAAALFTEPPRRRAAATYLRQRGIDASMLGPQWVLGYAPPRWSHLVDELRSEFSEQTLLDVGLARRSSRGTLIDAFRNRIIFGIHAADGTLAGFIGRDLSGHPNAPKYLNTRQHPLFDKGTLLYGLHEGHTCGPGQPVVVEGPLDALAVAARATRAPTPTLRPVAPCGTAFTAAQARLLARIKTDPHLPAVVAMDADSAGRTAALAVGEQLRQVGLDVRVAILPNGSDPADFLGRADSDVGPFCADQALPLVAAQVEHAIAQQGDSIQWVEGRLAALRSVARYLATYPADRIARQVSPVADALNLNPATVTSELVEACRTVRETDRPLSRSRSIGI